MDVTPGFGLRGAWLFGLGLLWALMSLYTAPVQAQDAGGSLKLGGGDLIQIEVFNRPELSTETYVADDGTVSVPLAGKVQVAGLSPAAAADSIEKAFVSGQFLINPQVSVTLTEFRSQQISILGEVGKPGRFPIDSRTTVLDALALAGGVTETGSYTVTVIRPKEDGSMDRFNIDLKALERGDIAPSQLMVSGGDSIFVPRAEQFYIMGAVNNPDAYRLEPGMTVQQAVAIGGGVTDRGSNRRIEIKRKQPDGSIKEFNADLDDPIQSGDVIRVKERIF